METSRCANRQFFILLFVLYKFAYKPVPEMLEKRSKTIEKGIHDAKASEERLKEIEQTRRKILDEAAREVGKLLEKAKADAEAMKKDLMADANEQAEDLLRRTKALVAEEKEKMTEDVKKKSQNLLFWQRANFCSVNFRTVTKNVWLMPLRWKWKNLIFMKISSKNTRRR